MDIKFKHLLLDSEKDSECSRSLPSNGCFLKCRNGIGSTESINSVGFRSPKLGRYTRIANQAECDECHKITKEVSNLKCLHSFCSKCLESSNIARNGCPVCNNLCNPTFGYNRKLGTKCSLVQGQEKYSPEKAEFTEQFAFDDFDEDSDVEQADSISLQDALEDLKNRVLTEVQLRHKIASENVKTLETETEAEIQKIRDHIEKVKKMIDKRAEAMIKGIRESYKRHLSEVARQEIFFRERIDDINLLIKQCKQVLNYTSYLEDGQDGGQIQAIETNVKNMIKKSEQMVNENVHIRLNVKPVTESNLDIILGKVGVRVFLERPLELELQSVVEFPAGVHSICPIDNEKAWVGYQTFIQLCYKNGRRQSPINVGQDVFDLTLSPSGTLLIACQSCIKYLGKDNTIHLLFRCNGTPGGIACKRDGQIIACLDKDVVLYDNKGETVSVLNKNSLCDIKKPFKVAVNTNGDICVSDYQSAAGEVFIFDSEGHLKSRIRTDGMAPRGIACNKQGLIFVGDFRADRVNVYATHGHFLQSVIPANSNGLSGPLSVSLDDVGDLWVGDWKRKVRIYSQRVAKREDSDVG